MKVVTISSWLNFGRPATPERGSAAGQKYLAPRYYGQRAVFASLRVLVSFMYVTRMTHGHYYASTSEQSWFVQIVSHNVKVFLL